MRPIHKVHLDKVRPAVILTREVARDFLSELTIAPISTRVLGIATEIPVGPLNGLEMVSAIKLDAITTVPAGDVGQLVGYLSDEQEALLIPAIQAAFDLD